MTIAPTPSCSMRWRRLAIGLADQDAPGTGRARRQHRQGANRPCAGHQDAAARLQAAAVDRVDGDRRRLDQRPLLIGDVVRQLDRGVVLDDGELAHSPQGQLKPMVAPLPLRKCRLRLPK